MVPVRSAATRSPDAVRSPGRPQRVALTALFAGAAAIAFAPILVRLSELDPVATAFYRLFFALPALWLWYGLDVFAEPPAAATRQRPGTAGIVAAGLFFAADLAVWHWSIRFTSVANATLLANFAPVFVTLAGFVLYGERFSIRFLLGLALAIGGAVALMGESISVSRGHLFGDLLGLITAVFYAGYIVAVGRLRARCSTAAIMAKGAVVTSAALFLVAVASGERMLATTAAGWTVLAALALVSQAGGQSLIAYALAHLPAAFSSAGLLLQPVLAAILAWLLLGEPLGPWQVAGGALVLAGIALARLGSRGARTAPDDRPT